MRSGKELSDLQRRVNKSIIVYTEKSILLTSIYSRHLQPRECSLGYYSTVRKVYCVKKINQAMCEPTSKWVQNINLH
jgi:hypothetical protein